MTRISIDEEMFKKLIRGEVVAVDDVEIALQDIGFQQMIYAIWEVAVGGKKSHAQSV
jgi:hypothetical protein